MKLSNPVGRVKGSNLTQPIRPKVKLVSMTENPIGTLFSVWHGSRHPRAVSAEDAETLYKYPEVIEAGPYYRELAEYICSCYPEHAGENGDDFRNVIKQVAKMNLIANVPSAESVYFTFQIDDATVAFREQLVRSKLASYWTQTSRTADLTTMDINMSEKIEYYGGQEAVEIYKETAEAIRNAYKRLKELGVPTEEIRLAPEARTHRVYWMISLRALLPIISKRLDWIAQLSLWGPVIADVIEILRGIDPFFTEFFGKPEVKIENGKVVYHKYDNENEDRYFARDEQPVDPLWLAYKGLTMPEHTNIKFYDDMKSMFIKLWDDEVLQILGWDRNDPSKLGPYDRPASYWDKVNPKMIEGLTREYNPES